MQTLSRRAVLALAAGGAAAALTIGRASAYDFVWFTPETKAELDATGKPYLIYFWATWCNTCRTQAEAIDPMLEAKPEYKAVPVVRIDWDIYVNGPLVAEWKIPRRSTILVMKNGMELHRSVAETEPAQLEALFKMALEA
jgi:thiol-disulfide isomerase/thioredoxin